jgi:hypothetical protein
MTLGRALHGRAAMAGVEAPWPAMGVLTREGTEGEGEQGGTARGLLGGAMGRGRAAGGAV